MVSLSSWNLITSYNHVLAMLRPIHEPYSNDDVRIDLRRIGNLQGILKGLNGVMPTFAQNKVAPVLISRTFISS